MVTGSGRKLLQTRLPAPNPHRTTSQPAMAGG